VKPILAFLAAILALTPARQQPQFRASADLVDVHVTVRTRDGVMARDLTKDDFDVLVDGKPVDIAVFSTQSQPVSMAFVLDNSGSVGAQFEQVQSAAGDFLNFMVPGDRASVSTLTWDCLPLTRDLRVLNTTLRTPLPLDMGSPIWAAGDRAITSLLEERARRAILLFSDGEDTQKTTFVPGAPIYPAGVKASGALEIVQPCEPATHKALISAKDLRLRAEAEGVMIYTVTVQSATPIGGGGDLNHLSEDSGGERYRLGSYKDLRVAFRRIAEELHLQYLIGFAPTAFDGKRHEIDVRAKRKGVTVRSRRAYVATRK